MKREAAAGKGRSKALITTDRTGMRTLSSLSGKEIIDRIVEARDPRALVQGLAHGDFYWIVKKVGANDCLPLLEHASEEQWQYLLDMELWNRDRLDLHQAATWLSRLRMADPHRLAKWLLSEGQATAYYFFYRFVQVELKQDEDPSDLPDGFFTLDGTYYIRVKDPAQRPLIEDLLRFLAGENLVAYQSFLLGLAGVLPAEAEEQLYRMRGVRLAEHGFLPFEEAISIYSPLNPEILGTGELLAEPEIIRTEEVPRELVPLSPFFHLNKEHALVSAVRGLSDPLLQDRVYLEFAGLCNQILSADGVSINDLDVLVKTCRKAAGYVNLSLEKACSGDVHKAAQILKKHSLVSLFRVGFGIVLQLKWDVARWMKDAWFTKHGLDLDFWGDDWGETIGGLLFEKPLFYCGNREDEQYRDFRGLTDFEKCREIVHNVMALDYLFSRLSERIAFPDWKEKGKDVTFHPLLFNVWARDVLGSRLSFEGIPIARARELFSRLRTREEEPPYQMPGFEDVFVKDMLRLGAVRDETRKKQATKTLSVLWGHFRAEYEQVALEDLDQRFSRYLTIMPSPEADPR
ncbi:MAG: hypothetical protein JRI80_08265 [Deltaproteobacteria bacterium]|nr:hypothetical protein [Deltaproteobacteria bacterium]